MGEASAMLALPPSVLRFWEKEFEYLKPKKTGKGNRLYTAEDLEQLRLIKHLLREEGYTIAGAREYLKKNRGRALEKVRLLHDLQSMRSFLESLKNNLP
jgi:DNA-binding transcriptional MerR regulator